jgi:DNA-binding winged helix-turn-helix (wHTH) protein/tetratricopeptide (TPR) repeat protein
VKTKTTIYSFGEFELNPLARELKRNGELIELTASAFDCLVYLVEHRERPVGRDELIAAVWGSADVSENLLAQTIARLRRTFNDDASEQRYIKTLPRVGYRWVLDTSVASHTVAPVIESPPGMPSEVDDVRPQVSRRSWLKYSLLATLLLLLIGAGGYWHWRTRSHIPLSANQGTAVVLPAEVDAPSDWAWLRLGLMDLIASDLRDAKIPVESSQTVLDLLGQTDKDRATRLAGFALVIHPRVTLTDNIWHVHLQAGTPGSHTWQADASSDNVLKAVRSANAFLLAQMGAEHSGTPTTGETAEQYLLRMDAASYAGSIDIERELIDKAPKEVRETLEFAHAKASFYCDQGEYETCKRELGDLLERLPADTQPVLRGRTLAQQWYVFFREHKYAEGEAVLSEAVGLLQKQNNTGYLAHAYAQRAELEMMDNKLDQAESDFGLARINYTLAGNTAGALGIDESLAELAMRRGRLTQALPTIQRAYDQYQRMGMRQFLPALLMDQAISQKLLLLHVDQLATTERYWPIDQKHWDFTEKVMRHVLVFQRASALAGNGRTTEASDLLEQLLTQIKLDPKGEPGLQGVVYVLLAKLALQRGELASAQSWISKAFAGQLQEMGGDKRDHADAWLTDVMIVQRSNNPKELTRVVDAMQAWAAGLPAQDEWISIQLLLARAIEARANGRPSEAQDQLKLAMNQANRLGVPELKVNVGLAYTLLLLEAGKVDEAAGIGGQLSVWGQQDWRAAWAQACVYRAMGRLESSEQYQRKARELAGDRPLTTDTSMIGY